MTENKTEKPSTPSPDELLTEFWKQSSASWAVYLESWKKAFEQGQQPWAEGMSRAWQDFARSMSSVAQGAVPGVGATPWSTPGANPFLANAGAFGFDPSHLKMGQEFFKSMAFPGQPSTQPENADAWLQNLEQAVTANLQASMKAMNEATERMGESMRASNPETLQRLWSGLAAEYAKDLAQLPARFAPARSQELQRLIQELSGRNPSPEARRYLERFLESLRVKSTLGPEYYVDPQATGAESAAMAGVNPTPHELVLEVGSLKLWRYGAAPHAPGRPPLLMVYSIINRPWILDLVPNFSVIAHLLARGLDVYLVEWEPAKPGNQDTLDDYVDPMMTRAVEKVRELSGLEPARPINLFGWCIGGTLALMYAAFRPLDIRRLITLTTPVTSSGSGILELFSDPTLFPMDEILKSNSMMPGKVVRAGIMSIKPYLEVLKWKSFYENLHDDRVMSLFYPLDRWANDNPDLAAQVFRRYIMDVYRDDAFVRGETSIHGRKVSLQDIRCPFLNLVAEDDWIVPVKAADRIVELIGSERRENVHIPGPHVGIVMDPRARSAWDRIADFALEKDES